jgi:HTH-type transcriptional regulator / antitoxin HipB
MKINSVWDLAATVRGRRRDLGLTQAELASRAQVSREWVNGFETGKATVEIGLVIRVLDALGMGLNLVVSDTTPDAASLDLDALLEEHRHQ